MKKKKNIFRITIKYICIVIFLLFFASRVSGFEFFDTISPTITTDPIEVVIWVMPGVTPANETRVLSEIQAGLQMWEDVPTSHLAFDIVNIVHSPVIPSIQPHQLRIRVGNGEDLSSGGASYPFNGNPGEWYGVVADANQIETEAVTTHEVGHAIGFIHSTITGRVYPIEQCPIMHWRVASLVPLLDDIAGISTAYPNPNLPLINVSGTIIGRLIDDACSIPISGINAIAVNTATSEPAVSRISGYAGAPGTFEIVGLPQGTYEVYFMDGHSMRGSYAKRNTPPATFYRSIQADNFTSFSTAPVSVSVGQEIDLGDITVPIFPITIDGYYLGHLDANDNNIPLTPIPDPSTFQLPDADTGGYEIWLHLRGGLRMLAGTVNGLPPGLTGEITGDPRGHNSAIHGSHYVHIYGTPTATIDTIVNIEIYEVQQALCGRLGHFNFDLSVYLSDGDNDNVPDMYDCDPLNPYLMWDLDKDTICEDIQPSDVSLCINACNHGKTIYDKEDCIYRCEHEDNCPCNDVTECPVDEDYNNVTTVYDAYCLPYKNCIQTNRNTDCDTMEEADYCHLYFANQGQYDGNNNKRGDHCESCLQGHITSVVEKSILDLSHGSIRQTYGPHEINILLEGSWLEIIPPILVPYPTFDWHEVPQRVTVGYCACEETDLDSDGFCSESVCPRDQELNGQGQLVWQPIYSDEAFSKPNVGLWSACNGWQYINSTAEPHAGNNPDWQYYLINKCLNFSHNYASNTHIFNWCPTSALADKYIQFRIAWQDPEETTYTYYNSSNPNEHKVNFYPPQKLWCGSIGGSIHPEQLNGMYNGLAIKLLYWSQMSWEEGPVGPVDPSPERLVSKVGVIVDSKLDQKQYLLTYDAQNMQLEGINPLSYSQTQSVFNLKGTASTSAIVDTDIFDVVMSKAPVLFTYGGYEEDDSTQTPTNTLWIGFPTHENNLWLKAEDIYGPQAGKGPQLYEPKMIYHERGRRLIVLGYAPPEVGAGLDIVELWTFGLETGTWQKIRRLEQLEELESGFSMDLDPLRNRAIIVGTLVIVHEQPPTHYVPPTLKLMTYVMNLDVLSIAELEILEERVPPLGLRYHGSFFDTMEEALYIYGTGTTDEGLIQKAYKLDLITRKWTDLTPAEPANGPGHRQDPFLYYNRKTQTMWIAGGTGFEDELGDIFYSMRDGSWETHEIFTLENEISTEINLPEGWNLISLPVDPGSNTIIELFPEAQRGYKYDRAEGRYIFLSNLKEEKMEITEAYWILLNKPHSSPLTGKPIGEYKHELSKEWILVGGCTSLAEPIVYNAGIAGIYSFVPGIGYQFNWEPYYIVPKQGQWMHFKDIKDGAQLHVKSIGFLSPPRTRLGSQENAGLWTLSMKATGQEAEEAVNVSTIQIGIASEASSAPLPFLPPPEYTLNLSIFENLLLDFRQISIAQQQWHINLIADTRVDLYEGIFYPTLSWNPEDIGPAHSIQLLDEAGNVLVADMRITSSYQVKHEEGTHTSHPTNEDITRSNYSYIIVFRPYTTTYYYDGDGDGYGDEDELIVALEQPEDYVSEAGDCDDNDLTRYPGKLEFCNGEDDDCDTYIDEEDAYDCTTYYKDEDKDGYGVDGDIRCLCGPEGIYTAAQGGDPNDLNPLIIPVNDITLNFELDFAQDGIFENCWTMQLNDEIKVDVYTSNVPSPGLISIGIDFLYDPANLQVTQETAVDMFNWNVAPQVIFEEGVVQMKGGRLLPGLEGDRIKLGTVVLECINLGVSELWIFDSDRQGSYDDFVLSDGTVLDAGLEGGILVGNINNLTMELDAGWNIISLPIVPESCILSDVFPEALYVYAYDKNEGYVRVEDDHELEVGKGYWILLDEAKTYSMIGEVIDEYKLSVQDGWYLIGGCSSGAKVLGDNCNIGVIYGYEQGFGYKRVRNEEKLKPGKGYWILIGDIADQARLNVQSLL